MITENPIIAEADAALFGSATNPPNAKRAAELYRAGAEAGDACATLRAGVFAAEGTGREANWNEALELLQAAAEMGQSSAQRQLRLLAGDTDDATRWAALRQRIDLEALLTARPLARVGKTSMVAVAEGYAPAGFSEWLIEQARNRLVSAPIYNWSHRNPESGELNSIRTAKGAGLGPLERDFVCAVLQARAADLCGLPICHHEPPNVLSYEVGQRYAPHYDFIPPSLLVSDPAFARGGQRAVTFVTYLNSDFEGGATRFPRLGIELRARPGDAIVFANVLEDGSPDENTLHEGAPVSSGRKWVLSQWIRSLPQPWR